MSALLSALRRVITDLSRTSEPWALVGGLAVSVRTEPRTTRDVDVAVAVADDASAEALTRDLLRQGYVLVAGVEQTDTGRLATMRLEPPGAGPVGALVDLLFATSGIEHEICGQAETLEVIEGCAAPVALVGHLIAMKVLSRDDARRPQDILDLRALISVAGDDDLRVARTAIQQIECRGFSRGRDLVTALDQLLSRFRS